jgi:hypothetical protein
VVLRLAAWSATVADVTDSGCSSEVFGKDYTVQVGDDDLVAGLVAVGDNQDLFEDAARADSVLD